MRRKSDIPAQRSALLASRECRICGREASEVHHLLFRSQGGDDERGNLIPLCHDCHGYVHAANKSMRRALGFNLLPEERAYLIRKLGSEEKAAAWLHRNYGIPEEAWHV